MTDDVTKVLKELHGIVNNFRVRGSGVAGNLKNGYTVKPGSSQIASGSSSTTPPPPSGCVFAQTIDFTCGLCFAGFLYQVGDILILPGINGQGDGTICPPGGSPTFQVNVDSVDGGGAITGVTIIPGIGFSVAPSSLQAFSGGSGFAFVASCTFA